MKRRFRQARFRLAWPDWLRRGDQAKADAQMADLYRQTFDTDAGRIVLTDLLRFTGIDRTTEGMGARDAAFADGKRRVGLRLCAMTGKAAGEAVMEIAAILAAGSADGEANA